MSLLYTSTGKSYKTTENNSFIQVLLLADMPQALPQFYHTTKTIQAIASLNGPYHKVTNYILNVNTGRNYWYSLRKWSNKTE